MAASRAELSVVIPVLNEKGNLEPLHARLVSTLSAAPNISGFEIIFVDDGSTDGTFEGSAAWLGTRSRVIHLKRTEGQSRALLQGFAAARFPYLATMDGDLQNLPEDIPAMLQRVLEGTDFVQGWRADRYDPWARRLIARISNLTHRTVLGGSFRDVGCPLRVFRRQCIEHLDAFEGWHRFLPYLVKRGGFRVLEVPVGHAPRVAGRTKYSLHNRLGPALFGLFRLARRR